MTALSRRHSRGIGIRREDKSEWQRREPVTSQDAADLQEQGVRVRVQPSDLCAVTDKEFAKAGAAIQEDLSLRPVVFGIKEMPESFLEPSITSVFVFDPLTSEIIDGHTGPGVVILAVDIPPREASADLGRVLKPFIPAIARCDFSAPLVECELPPEIKRAVITYQGKLTSDYYIQEYQN
ncbi:MAG: hypothetical protein PVH17_10280 [Anaerolineae bacterium]|jgi:hypothetical protein